MSEAPDLGELLRAAVVVVATADADRRPAVARAWGPVLSGDGSRLRVYVEAAESSPTLANLRAGRPIAVTITRPSTYVSVQLKGAIAGTATATDAEHADALRHADAFVAETALLGLPEPVGRAMFGGGLVAVDVEVAERFDQTPGPGAGRRL